MIFSLTEGAFQEDSMELRFSQGKYLEVENCTPWRGLFKYQMPQIMFLFFGFPRITRKLNCFSLVDGVKKVYGSIFFHYHRSIISFKILSTINTKLSTKLLGTRSHYVMPLGSANCD